MSRLDEIAQRWEFPGHYFADVTPEQIEDVRHLLAEVKRLQQLESAVRVFRRGPKDWTRGEFAYLQDIDDALAALDESEANG